MWWRTAVRPRRHLRCGIASRARLTPPRRDAVSDMRSRRRTARPVHAREQAGGHRPGSPRRGRGPRVRAIAPGRGLHGLKPQRQLGAGEGRGVADGAADRPGLPLRAGARARPGGGAGGRRAPRRLRLLAPSLRRRADHLGGHVRALTDELRAATADLEAHRLIPRPWRCEPEGFGRVVLRRLLEHGA